MQAIDLAVIALVCRTADGNFGQMVAQDVFGIDRAHRRAAFGVDGSLLAQRGGVARRPGIEGRAVEEEVAQRVVRGGNGIAVGYPSASPLRGEGFRAAVEVAQAAQEDRVVDMVLRQQLQRVHHERGRFAARRQAELGGHALEVGAAERLRILADRAGRGFHRHQRHQRLGQLGEVPCRDVGLLVEGVAPAGVGMVADIAGVEGVEKAERAIVEREAEDGHVVGIHHPVREAHRLPLRHQLGGGERNLAQELGVGIGQRRQLGVVARDDVIGQVFDRLDLVAVVEHLERTEAHEARRQPCDQRGGFLILAVDRAVAADDGEGAGGRNAERMHRFGTQKLADARAQHRAAVAAARVGGAAGALQLHFPAFARGILHFAQQDRTAVTQLRHVLAELVAGVERGDRVHAR